MANKEWFKAKGVRARQYWRQRSLKDRPNIVLISLDTLRADHVGCYGYNRDTTPNIDRLAAEGIVFKNAFSTSAWTVPAHMSMLSGLWPMDHGLVQYPNPGVLPRNIPLLSDILWKAGYMTLGFHGGGYVAPHWGFSQGFHIYQTKGHTLVHNISLCLQWMRKFRNRRIFLFLHGFDCHRPYAPPDVYDIFGNGNGSKYDVAQLYEKDAPLPQGREDIEKIVAKYDGGVRYADHMIGEVMNGLDDLGILENTLIIVTSDHGDELGEHGYYDHIKSLYDETIRIPLVVRGAAVPGNGISVTNVVSLVDIVPTVAHAVGVTPPPECSGIDLLIQEKGGSGGTSRVVYGSTGYQREFLEKKEDLRGHPFMPRPQLLHYARSRDWKLIAGGDGRAVELYNVSDDPMETVNKAEMYPKIREELTGHLRQRGWHQRWDEKLSGGGEIGNEELKAQLKELGYL